MIGSTSISSSLACLILSNFTFTYCSCFSRSLFWLDTSAIFNSLIWVFNYISEPAADIDYLDALTTFLSESTFIWLLEPLVGRIENLIYGFSYLKILVIWIKNQLIFTRIYSFFVEAFWVTSGFYSSFAFGDKLVTTVLYFILFEVSNVISPGYT